MTSSLRCTQIMARSFNQFWLVVYVEKTLNLLCVPNIVTFQLTGTTMKEKRFVLIHLGVTYSILID